MENTVKITKAMVLTAIEGYFVGMEADEINLCFEYNDISFDGSRRNVENHFYTASGYSKQAGLELVNDSYIAINELI